MQRPDRPALAGCRDDVRGLPVTTTSAQAMVELDAAVRAMLAHAAEGPARLQAALAADAGLVMGHALAGLQQRLLARGETAVLAGRSLAAARRALTERGGTRREHAFIAALAAWQEGGDMAQAAMLLETQLAEQPLDAAALKLAHAIRFMLGDAAGMRLAVERALPAWRDGVAGHGFILGCHAFALEETGEAAAAERAGRAAVAREADDLWGAHAVAHALEGAGRAREGLRWLADTERGLAGAGNFARHLFWHRALFHLHLGETGAALDLYDRRVRDEPTEDFRDVANAASLLWRIEAQGLPVGAARWDELADIAERRVGDHSLAFADLHHVLSLAAAGRKAALAAFLAGMRGRALRDVDTQARVHAAVGLAAARAVAAAVGGASAEAADLFAAIRRDLPRLGGSHAQRDLFERIGIDATIAAGRPICAGALLAERATRRAFGAWEAERLRRMRPPARSMRHDAEPTARTPAAMTPQRIARRAVLASAGLLATMSHAGAQDGAGLVTRASTRAAVATIAAFEAAVREAGWRVLGKVDHAAAAREQGLSLPARMVILFGNPRAGTPAMQQVPTLALDLPMRVLVWEDAGGRVFVTRGSGEDTAERVFARHGITISPEDRGRMEAMLESLVQKAIRQP